MLMKPKKSERGKKRFSKQLPLLPFIVAVIVLAFLIIYKVSTPLKPPQPEEPRVLVASCESLKVYTERFNCYVQLALENKSATLCNSILFRKDREYCYKEIAIKMSDEQLCGKIQNSTIMMAACYRAVAVAKNNSSICNPLKGDEFSFCYALAKRSAYYCGKIESDKNYREVCYSDLAFLTKDKRICSLISNSDTKKNCFYNLGIR